MKITSYKCDLCKKMINTDDEPVHILHPGKIGYQDTEILDQDESSVRHYHKDCMSRLLSASLNEETEENDPENVEEQDYIPTKKEDSRKDLGKIKALLNAGWNMKEIADDLGVSKSCAYRWKKEIEDKEKA